MPGLYPHSGAGESMRRVRPAWFRMLGLVEVLLGASAMLVVAVRPDVPPVVVVRPPAEGAPAPEVERGSSAADLAGPPGAAFDAGTAGPAPFAPGRPAALTTSARGKA